MKIRIAHLLLPAAAGLALAACDNEPEAGDANLAGTNDTALAGADYAGTEASLDPVNLRADVVRIMESGGAAGGSGATGTGTGATGTGTGATDTTGAPGTTGGADANASGGADGTGANDGGGSAAGGSAAGGGTSGFAGADRDGDGRISPAEYAVMTMPSVDPAEKAAGADDEMRPYVSDEALNEAISSFRRLDTNGDFYLSAEEYGAGG